MSPASRCRTARVVAAIPSARALRTIWRTRSGRARALASRLARASSVTARSVPGEMTEATGRTSTPAGPGDDRRGGPREAQGRPGREVPMHGHRVPAAPGDDVVDHERVRGQRPPPAVDRPAGQVAVPVVTGGAHDGPAVSVGGQPVRA